ncbi:hypothetical protein Bhyg_04125 [Pseudolycoriella hygida]|uniref:Uncharacterized protein n=1 Tax=Pseudolycoriella hygida TaxID=35572 RepID=A0A9Q0S9C8_9DIPT|nr:hypothetical protein Bhyg_04125 [Pseudolycoriella hygida]
MTSSFERSDYPEIMETDTDIDKAYVSAYSSGEQLGVCDQVEGWDDRRKIEFCDENCRTSYGQGCQDDKNSSYAVRFYHTFARYFHNSGMFAFGAMWYARQAIDDTINKIKEVRRAVQNSAIEINNKLIALQSEFEEWIASENKRQKRSAVDAIYFDKWLPFLESKNSTDPDLFSWLGAYEYTQFEFEASKFNSTVHSFDFDNSTSSVI